MASPQEMRVANTIAFEDTLKTGLQQTKSKLQDKVEVRSYHGEKVRVMQVFQPSEARTADRESMLPTIKYNETKQEAKWLDFEISYYAEIVPPYIKLEQSINPLGIYAQQATYALVRKRDEVIMRGLLGENQISTSKGKKAEPFLEKHIIRNTIKPDPAFRGLTSVVTAMIRAALSLMENNHIDTEQENITLVLPPSLYYRLFIDEHIINRDYSSAQVLDNHKVQRFMGVNIITFNNILGHDHCTLDKDIMSGIDPKNNYYCPMFCKSGALLGEWDNLKVKVDTLPQHMHATQILAQFAIGATRTQSEKVLCLEIPKEETDAIPTVAKPETQVGVKSPLLHPQSGQKTDAKKGSEQTIDTKKGSN
ncbi:MAG: hypothetical protein C4617_05860 [Candidatus Liberibacter europaeus]|uniref:Capsid protein n=1 Tax=Candidatus Liberibacter europaeus TaxID=744859 RepID=A0A2T4VW54_9HYPH|nr:hypothetical protein [Candidatus Liberibacter europaeus]PTL86016.1 MAG: hypothetical protein C4617_05860 [Candidatus Liberibacter europaeus]